MANWVINQGNHKAINQGIEIKFGYNSRFSINLKLVFIADSGSISHDLSTRHFLSMRNPKFN